MIEKHYGRYMPQAGDFDLIEAALGGGRKVKPNVKPSDLADPALSGALRDSIAKTGTSERATRWSRTGDLLITNDSEASRRPRPSPAQGSLSKKR